MRPRALSPSIELFPAATPTLPPATHTNSYALGTREVVLVEPATPYEAEQRAWIAWARGLASRGRTATAIFVTHHHPDHIGGLAVLARELGLPVWAHERLTRLVPTAKVDRTIDDGASIVLDGPTPTRWTALYTPGHASDHVCLFDEGSKTLIAGDMVASVGTIVVPSGDGDMRAYLDQLRRLASLGARLALPAHGEPIDDPPSLFDRYIAHRLAREAKVVAALVPFGAVGANVTELVPLAYADTPVHLWPFARESLLAHLGKLVAEGRARTNGETYVAAEGVAEPSTEGAR